MNKHFSYVALAAIILSCGKIDRSHITFSGNIKNNSEKIIKVTNYNSTLKQEIAIDSLGDFSGQVLVDKDGYYFFQVGRSYTTVRFKRGHNVNVQIDANNFYKSMSYSCLLYTSDAADE